MKVLVSSAFPHSEWRFRLDYEREASAQVAQRFQNEVDEAVAKIKSAPLAAGHIVYQEPEFGLKFRRRNLRKFPFCILYMFDGELLVLANLLPSRSDQKNWLKDFRLP